MKSDRLSYTKLSTYAQCPKKFYHIYVARDVKRKPYDPGISGHQQLQRYLERDTEELPDRFTSLQPTLNALREMPVLHVERSIKLNEKWSPIETKWDYHILSIFDVITQGSDKSEAVIIDWKTGKVRDYSLQELIAAAVYLSANPHVEQLRSKIVFTDHRHIQAKLIERDELPKMIEQVEAKGRQIKSAEDRNDWPPNTSPLCGWCPCTLNECPFAKNV